MDKFTTAYIAAGLQLADHEIGSEVAICDLPAETTAKCVADCAQFQETNRALLTEVCDNFAYDMDQAGTDFWLTRNRHGAGFWDRDIDQAGDVLTEAAHKFPECDFYLGDNGKVYLA